MQEKVEIITNHIVHFWTILDKNTQKWILCMDENYRTTWSSLFRQQESLCNGHWLCPNVSTTPITAMGYWQCLTLSVVQLKGKHCRKPHCHNGVVDTFGQYLEIWNQNGTYGSTLYLVYLVFSFLQHRLRQYYIIFHHFAAYTNIPYSLIAEHAERAMQE